MKIDYVGWFPLAELVLNKGIGVSYMLVHVNNNFVGWFPLVELVLNKGIGVPCRLVPAYYCRLVSIVSWCLQLIKESFFGFLPFGFLC